MLLRAGTLFSTPLNMQATFVATTLYNSKVGITAKKYWKFGFSKPIACRFGDDDAYGRLHWRWPVKMVDNSLVPLEKKPPEAIAKYMIKYLQKSEHNEGDYWRCRMSQKRP